MGWSNYFLMNITISGKNRKASFKNTFFVLFGRLGERKKDLGNDF